jgi:hypothetical protein
MARRPRAPLRNGAGDQPSVVEVAMAEADDDNVVYPLTGNDDLRAAGLVLEDDNDICEDAATLLGINVGSGSAPIDLDAGDGGGGARTTTGTRFGSTSTDGTSSVGKRKSGVWVDF